MKLAPERAGPYARALRVALEALAPNEDHVPLAAASRHLRALDPAVSGTLLTPAEVVDATGMPAYPWMERVEAEAAPELCQKARWEGHVVCKEYLCWVCKTVRVVSIYLWMLSIVSRLLCMSEREPRWVRMFA